MIIHIPDDNLSEFFGIMTLDILHDSKTKGFLEGVKFCTLTDLIAESIIFHNNIQSISEIKDWFFIIVLKFFCEMWRENLGALGIVSPVNFYNISFLREQCVLPIRNITDTSVLISLGNKSTSSIESQNYYFQKNKLQNNCINFLEFKSPFNETFFQHANQIVQGIKNNTKPTVKVVLDMKASAGLIRTICDPIGYITPLPNFADPGYYMPGMSTIRESSTFTFGMDPKKTYNYNYSITFNYNGNRLIFYDINYFYGVNDSIGKIERKNITINLMNDTIHNNLPHSGEMANLLSNYSKLGAHEISLTIRDAFERLNIMILEYYEENLPFHRSGDILNTWNNVEPEWCKEPNLKDANTAYYLATIENMTYFNIPIQTMAGCPTDMIQNIIPRLLTEYSETQNENLLLFCNRQINLLKEYTNYPNVDKSFYLNLMTAQKMNRNSKLLNQLEKHLLNWKKEIIQKLEESSEYINTYLLQLGRMCEDNLYELVSETDGMLNKIPVFNPPIALKSTLIARLNYSRPDIQFRSKNYESGILLYSLLSILLDRRALYICNFSLETVLNKMVQVKDRNYFLQNALVNVLGKFSGDFGQIVWCIEHGELFASEDNNTSAMALLLHRICKNTRWGNIHGLGDGSSVQIFIQK